MYTCGSPDDLRRDSSEQNNQDYKPDQLRQRAVGQKSDTLPYKRVGPEPPLRLAAQSLRAEPCQARPDAEGFAADQRETDPQSQNILHTKTLMPQKRKIAHDHQNSESEHHRHHKKREHKAGHTETLVDKAHKLHIDPEQALHQDMREIQPAHRAEHAYAEGPDRIVRIQLRAAAMTALSPVKFLDCIECVVPSAVTCRSS